MTPLEAKEARKRARNRPKASPAPNAQAPSIIEHEAVVRTFRDLPQITADIEGVIAAIVRAHVASGGAFILEQVAGILEGEGRRDIASLIRQHLGGGRSMVHAEN